MKIKIYYTKKDKWQYSTPIKSETGFNTKSKAIEAAKKEYPSALIEIM